MIVSNNYPTHVREKRCAEDERWRGTIIESLLCQGGAEVGCAPICN